MRTVHDLLDENVVQILTYLRAVDLASAMAANKRAFSEKRINSAIEALVKDVYNLPTSSPVKKVLVSREQSLRRPDYLYSNELFCLSTALNAQPPLGPKGTSFV